MATTQITSIPRELLQPARPVRLILYALADWAAIVAVWIVAWFAPFWLYPLWVVLLATRFHALGVVLHDAVHMPLRRKNGTLRLVELLAGYPVGSTLEAMRYHHLRHHRDLGLSGDPYLKPWIGRSVFRHWLVSFRYFLLTPLWVLRGFYGTLAFYVPGLRNSYGRWFLQDRSGRDLTSQPEVIGCAREEHGQLIFYIVVCALAFVWPRRILEFYIAPLVLAGWLAGQRLLYEHIQEPTQNRSREEIERTTRNHHIGLLGRVLLAPHNVGYHLVHHLYPQVALENLPRLDEWHQAASRKETFVEFPRAARPGHSDRALGARVFFSAGPPPCAPLVLRMVGWRARVATEESAPPKPEVHEAARSPAPPKIVARRKEFKSWQH